MNHGPVLELSLDLELMLSPGVIFQRRLILECDPAFAADESLHWH